MSLYHIIAAVWMERFITVSQNFGWNSLYIFITMDWNIKCLICILVNGELQTLIAYL